MYIRMNKYRVYPEKKEHFAKEKSPPAAIVISLNP
jgi:hypothetical protein